MPGKKDLVAYGTLCATIVATFLGFAYLDHHSIATGDYLIFVSQRGLGGHFDGLWGQNELHLMVLPRAIWSVDEIFSGGHFTLTAIIALACLGVVSALGALQARRDSVLADDLRLPVAFLATAFAFSTTHLEIVAEPQKLWIPVSVTCVIATLYLVSLPWSVRPLGAFLAACALIVAGSISGIAGLFAMPTAIALACRLGKPRWGVTGIAAAGLIGLVLFLRHINLPHPTSSMGEIAGHLGRYLFTVGRFLGAPIARILSAASLADIGSAMAATAGVGGLGLAAFFWLRFIIAPLRWADAALWLGTAAFAVLWAASVSFRDFADNGPILSRYDLPVSLFWASLIALSARTARSALQVRWTKAALGLVLGGLLVVQIGFGVKAREGADMVSAVKLALAVGVNDPSLAARINYTAGMTELRTLLMSRGLPPFAASAITGSGTNAPAVAEQECPAEITESLRLPDGGLRLRGRTTASSFAVRVLDAENHLVGRGELWRGTIFGPQVPGQWLAYVQPHAADLIRIEGDLPEGNCRITPM